MLSLTLDGAELPDEMAISAVTLVDNVNFPILASVPTLRGRPTFTYRDHGCYAATWKCTRYSLVKFR